MSTRCALQIHVDLAGSTLPRLATGCSVSPPAAAEPGGVDSPLGLGSAQPGAVRSGFVASSKIAELDVFLGCLGNAALITSGFT